MAEDIPTLFTANFKSTSDGFCELSKLIIEDFITDPGAKIDRGKYVKNLIYR
jgi:hypothetical protein